MKPEFEKIIEPAERSFSAKVVQRANRPLLSKAWHYHPELEICLTLESEGRRFVGNQIDDYRVNDLVMFGSNLPHGFTTDVACKQVVVQMNEDFLGEDFLTRPEVSSIKNLFKKARRGLEFQGKVKKKCRPLFSQLLATEGFARLRTFLEILEILADSHEVKPICTKEYSTDFNVDELNRVKVVYDHVIASFKHDISIKEIADKLNISESGFYKFIKQHTKKTYTTLVNEFRVNHASRLLMNTDLSITEIGYDSGYNNISYFNRKFKENQGCTPAEFRKRYAGNNKGVYLPSKP